MQADDVNDAYSCDACNSKVKGYHRFCHNCGEYLGIESSHINLFNNSYLRSAFIFFTVYLFICLLVQFSNWFNNYSNLFWIEILLAAITLYHFFKILMTYNPY